MTEMAWSGCHLKTETEGNGCHWMTAMEGSRQHAYLGTGSEIQGRRVTDFCFLLCRSTKRNWGGEEAGGGSG